MILLPQRLQELRKSKKLTQQNMADYLEVQLRTYQYYEGGGRRPDLETLVILADYFDVTLDYLVGRSDIR
ncbi:MAG: helix-turn-helix transcriptional regulator [Oscillospiraceae bacterium]|nr:helix-turn-helix transcriptional regulator [Oscillospiraceae bacterium]